jgi:hypothetical protein
MPFGEPARQTVTEPSRSTAKRLYARSGNRCAFEECSLPIFEESGCLTGTVCHIKARSPGGPRYDTHQTEEERHGYDNLILLCARHSKLIDFDTASYTVEVLTAMKKAHEIRTFPLELTQSDTVRADTLLGNYRAVYNINAGGNVMINSAGAVQANSVTIKTTKRSVKILPAEGSLGASAVHRNYVKHLIDRYNDFASKQSGREFRYAVVYGAIKRQFKADWERIPLNCFTAMVEFLQSRINKTQLGRINNHTGNRNYSTFDEYKTKYTGETQPATRQSGEPPEKNEVR